MKWKWLAMLLMLAVLLTACAYVVVEDPERQTIGSILLPAANAEGAETPHAAARALPRVNHDAQPLEEEAEEALPAPSLTPAPAPKTIARGAKGDQVKALQILLREYGFLNGKADGDFGAKTQNAVIAAQNYKHALEEAARLKARKALEEALKEASARVAASLEALRPMLADDAAQPQSAIQMTRFTANLVKPAPQPAFKADGVVTEELLSFLEEEFAVYAGDLKKGSGGLDVKRLQTRLNDMYYLYGGIDGSFGGNTQLAVKYFQRLNGLEETGIADAATQKRLFSSACKQSDYPMYRYRVEISVSKQKVYVYQWNYGAYSKLVKTMKCTTGAVDTPTPLGSFAMGGPCGKWYYFSKFECWAQYASRITGGILFHSVLYSERDTSTLRQGSVNALGSRGSHGCVRLAVEDAKWIYNNVPGGTICRVYN